MRFFHTLGFFLLASILLVSCATPKGNTKQEKRGYVLNMKNETLSKLYRENPEAKSKIKNAAGHAVFSSINTNLFLFSSGNGYGVAIENSSGKKTYMKMNFIGVGPGIGLKDFRAVFIFKNKRVFNDFVEKVGNLEVKLMLLRNRVKKARLLVERCISSKILKYMK